MKSGRCSIIRLRYSRLFVHPSPNRSAHGVRKKGYYTIRSETRDDRRPRVNAEVRAVKPGRLTWIWKELEKRNREIPTYDNGEQKTAFSSPSCPVNVCETSVTFYHVSLTRATRYTRWRTQNCCIRRRSDPTTRSVRLLRRSPPSIQQPTSSASSSTSYARARVFACVRVYTGTYVRTYFIIYLCDFFLPPSFFVSFLSLLLLLPTSLPAVRVNLLSFSLKPHRVCNIV